MINPGDTLLQLMVEVIGVSPTLKCWISYRPSVRNTFGFWAEILRLWPRLLRKDGGHEQSKIPRILILLA